MFRLFLLINRLLTFYEYLIMIYLIDEINSKEFNSIDNNEIEPNLITLEHT
jgi:hypothetical protein